MRRRTPPQKRISESEKRFNIACWGRQSGKTTCGLDKMLYKPLLGRPKGVYWYILQTHSAAHIAFQRYWELVRTCPQILKKKPHESGKFFTLINDATVYFKSGDNFEDLRTETLDGCIIDEYRQQDPRLWPMIIRPMLGRRKGWADILSTPNGFDHFYELFEAAQKDPAEWGHFHAPSTQAWWWSEDEIQSAQSSMTEDEFSQEILAEFREIGIGKAYISHGLHNQKTINPFTNDPNKPWSPYLPLIVGLDFNVSLMCWVIGQTRGGDWYFGDEIALKQTNTEMQVPLLIDKVKGHPSGVILVGDASGKSQKTSASGKTDYTIIENALKQAGIKFQNHTPESNPPVKDRINCVNARLKAANGEVHLWYHPSNCKRLKKDLERVSWKQGATGAMLDKNKDPELTHASDAFGYPITHFSEQWRPRPGVARIILRT